MYIREEEEKTCAEILVLAVGNLRQDLGAKTLPLDERECHEVRDDCNENEEREGGFH